MPLSLLFKRNLRSFALAFPGQGIIKPGLLKPYILLKDTILRDEIITLESTLGESFTDNLFSEEKRAIDWLSYTSNAQPAILTTSYFLYLILKRKYNVDLIANHVNYVLGHSLGEYTALLINGNLDFESALKLVSTRGKLMEEVFSNVNGAGNQYSMKALLFKPSEFEYLCDQFSNANLLANLNNKSQIVVSGKNEDISHIINTVNRDKKRIMRSITLPVRIPFHSNVLASIQPMLQQLCSGNIKQGKVPIISNISGLPVSDGEEIVRNTIQVNSKPVQWVKSMEYLVNSDKVTDVINFGPGDTLQGLNSKFQLKNHKIDSLNDMEAFVRYLNNL